MKRRWYAALWAGLLLPVAAIGCQTSMAGPALPPPKTPEVTVALPTTKQVTDYEEFTGQTQALKTVDIRARVTGYLTQVDFKDGDEVEEGAVLFEIDSRPYETELKRAEATASQAEARLARLERDFARAEKLISGKTITQEQYDQVSGDRNEAIASLRAANAQLEMARLNMSYTRVTAPVSGRLSRRMVDPGNLVKADETILTRIVTQEPMYVYFDLDERTMLRIRRLVRAGATASIETADVPVFIGLADEQDYPHQGVLNFEDNQVDVSTGTLRVRGVFDNADRLLKPGLFVKVRVPVGEPYTALLVPEQSIGRDQGQKFVYVVDGENKVEYRRVQVGRAHDGKRVVFEGLKPGEQVVLTGLQRVRPGAEVVVRSAEAAETAALPKREGLKHDGAPEQAQKQEGPKQEGARQEPRAASESKAGN